MSGVASATAVEGGSVNTLALAKMVGAIQHTVGDVQNSLEAFNEQSNVFNNTGTIEMDRTAEIQELQRRLQEHGKAQRRLVRAMKNEIRVDFKTNIADRLRDDISAKIREEVALQVKQQVDEQIQDHIPIPLAQQSLENKRQISDIRVTLANSEAREKNSHLQATNLDELLMPILKPDGTESELFPADLRALFAYDLEMSKALLKDFEMEAGDSLQVNFGRFIRHIGIENFQMLG